jgi:hypothetical protein
MDPSFKLVANCDPKVSKTGGIGIIAIEVLFLILLVISPLMD